MFQTPPDNVLVVGTTRFTAHAPSVVPRRTLAEDETLTPLSLPENVTDPDEATLALTPVSSPVSGYVPVAKYFTAPLSPQAYRRRSSCAWASSAPAANE